MKSDVGELGLMKWQGGDELQESAFPLQSPAKKSGHLNGSDSRASS